MCGELVVSDSQRAWRQADWVVQCGRIRTEETYSRRTQVGRDSSVGTATGYELGGPGTESRLRRDFPHLSQTGPGAHPASCIVGTEYLFRG